jgi:peptidoglycan-associated lipoprotein
MKTYGNQRGPLLTINKEFKMRILTKISLALIPAMFLLGGCGSEEVKPTAAADAPPSPAVPVETSAAQPMAAAPVVDPLNDPDSMLSQRKVYFEYDSSVVQSDSMPVIRAHAEYLSSNNGMSFTLEGHADERGTREYNIALGERRADAVRRILVANGVSDGQIKVISYGEERPAAFGHAENSWSRNRRAEMMYSQ